MTDPDGRPLDGATVTFTLARPGRPGDHLEADPDRGRTAGAVTTTIPNGATNGQRPCTVIVRRGRARERDRPDRHHDQLDRAFERRRLRRSRSRACPTRGRCTARPRRRRDSVRDRSYHSPHVWRCPHCGTPQPVAARCWVCRAVLDELRDVPPLPRRRRGADGYCGLDRRREPLVGGRSGRAGRTWRRPSPSIRRPGAARSAHRAGARPDRDAGRGSGGSPRRRPAAARAPDTPPRPAPPPPRDGVARRSLRPRRGAASSWSDASAVGVARPRRAAGRSGASAPEACADRGRAPAQTLVVPPRHRYGGRWRATPGRPAARSIDVAGRGPTRGRCLAITNSQARRCSRRSR